jgi:hypothetical protein
MGESLREIVQALTRYSANAPEFPVNDPPLFTGQIQTASGDGAVLGIAVTG